MKLEDIQKLCDDATCGPWKANQLSVIVTGMDNNYLLTNSGHNDSQIIVHSLYWSSDFDFDQSVLNAKFIAASRDLLPKLLAVAKAAQNLLDAKDFESEGDYYFLDLYDSLEELEKE